MRTTIVVVTLALVVSSPAYSQDKEDTRTARWNSEQVVRGPGSPQFRGGQVQPGESGRSDLRWERRGRQVVGESGRLGRAPQTCPYCGAPLVNRRGPGLGRGNPRVGQQRLAPERERRGYGNRPRYGRVDRAPGRWGRVGPGGQTPQSRPGLGPRRRGLGGPPSVEQEGSPRDWGGEDRGSLPEDE